MKPKKGFDLGLKKGLTQAQLSFNSLIAFVNRLILRGQHNENQNLPKQRIYLADS